MTVGVWLGNSDPRGSGGSTFTETVSEELLSHPTDHRLVAVLQGASATRATDLLLPTPRKKRPVDSLLLRARKLFGYGSRKPTARTDNILRRSVDLLYSPRPVFLTEEVPAILTVWDLAHRLYPFFPEVSTTGWTWDERESFYQKATRKAAFVIAGTAVGGDQVCRFYNVDRSRIRVIPFPARRLPTTTKLESVVPAGWPFAQSFLFYPAQFWPHKNHVGLLEALAALKALGEDIGLILTGGDKGNRHHVSRLVEEWGLADRVLFAGYVSTESLAALYGAALAVVFPSFFGPDNLPPLEAMACGCPVAVADIEGAREYLSDAALYFDPMKPDDIAQAVISVVRDSNVRAKLVESGKRIAETRTPKAYVESLIGVFDEFASVRRLWASPIG